MFKGKKKGIIKTMDMNLSDLKAVFFPSNFCEKFKYLGCVPWDEEGKIFKTMEPLVIYMDYKAKPYWCPRWTLRFLHLFGNDNSVVRVRNWKLHNLHRKLTKGIMLTDYKTKWTNYDLRISVMGSDDIHNLAEQIEENFYKKGHKNSLLNGIKKINPNFDEEYLPNHKLEEYLKSLTQKKS